MPDEYSMTFCAILRLRWMAPAEPSARKNTCPASSRSPLAASHATRHPEDSRSRTATSTPATTQAALGWHVNRPGSRPMPNASTVKSMYGQSSSSSSSMKRWLM